MKYGGDNSQTFTPSLDPNVKQRVLDMLNENGIEHTVEQLPGQYEGWSVIRVDGYGLFFTFSPSGMLSSAKAQIHTG